MKENIIFPVDLKLHTLVKKKTRLPTQVVGNIDNHANSIREYSCNTFNLRFSYERKFYIISILIIKSRITLDYTNEIHTSIPYRFIDKKIVKFFLNCHNTKTNLL